VFSVAAAIAVVALLAGFVYLYHERQRWSGVGLAVLRVIGVGALLLLLLNPVRIARVTGGAPTVLLDASLSMQAAGGRWHEAVDSARSLTRGGGAILRFGSHLGPFDGSPPAEGATRLRDALTAARARGGPTIVVTDGEIEDAGSLPPALTPGTRFVLLPRDTVPSAALLTLDVPERVQRDDSLSLTLGIGTWGALSSDTGRLVVTEGERRLALVDLPLPRAPGSARRRIALRPGLLAAGPHIIRLDLQVEGDREPRDDERYAVVEVSEQPAVVVVVDPADWEGRFLVTELADVARTTVRGYARTGRRTWLDMRTLGRVGEDQVQMAARSAGLLVLRGRLGVVAPERRGPLWLWPTADPRLEVLEGDWYLTGDLPASPLAGRLAALEWDSLAPLTGIVSIAPRESEWVALAARQGRRGAEQPVLLGRDSAGTRALTTAGIGLWRWRFRGGAAREAYRAILAAATDWLLVDRSEAGNAAVRASPVVQAGMPVVFRWPPGESVPDSLQVTLRADTVTFTRTLRFRPDGSAILPLDPGVYRWAAPDVRDARGVAVVEPFSDEYPARTVLAPPAGVGEAFTLLERHARERWWLFVVAVLALAAEWAWRQRRGLP
jgi:hypothetical protein